MKAGKQAAGRQGRGVRKARRDAEASNLQRPGPTVRPRQAGKGPHGPACERAAAHNQRHEGGPGRKRESALRHRHENMSGAHEDRVRGQPDWSVKSASRARRCCGAREAVVLAVGIGLSGRQPTRAGRGCQGKPRYCPCCVSNVAAPLACERGRAGVKTWRGERSGGRHESRSLPSPLAAPPEGSGSAQPSSPRC